MRTRVERGAQVQRGPGIRLDSGSDSDGDSSEWEPGFLDEQITDMPYLKKLCKGLYSGSASPKTYELEEKQNQPNKITAELKPEAETANNMQVIALKPKDQAFATRKNLKIWQSVNGTKIDQNSSDLDAVLYDLEQWHESS